MLLNDSPPRHVPFIDQVRQELHWNIGDGERSLSTVAGAGLLGFGVTQRGWKRWVLMSLASALLKRGITGRCDVYSLLHIDTRHRL
jgi:hypothetical protein